MRFSQLDSLRGLAALTVVLSHFSLVIPNSEMVTKLKYTPLHIFWGGHEAVIMFFLLSGFVLSIPYFENKQSSYLSFLIKRLCRIYIPYLFSIIIGYVCVVNFSHYGVDGLSAWVNGAWNSTIDFKLLLNHVLFIGDYNNTAMNPVIWSLVHEMRVSIIFPVLMILVLKLNWKTNVLICLVMTFVYYALAYITTNYFGQINMYNISFISSIHYASFFILGALLAKNRVVITEIVSKLNRINKIIMFVFAVFSYTYTWWAFPDIHLIHLTIINDWFIGIGSLIFIVLSLSSSTVNSILMLKPIQSLGKISYSLYLLHAIVLLSFVNILYGIIPLWSILVLVFVSSLFIAILSYYFIEINSIKLGKSLVSKMNAKRNTDLIKSA
jgi:peptidoglycan/LPS O-acetylase OafA/YrhL